MPSYGPTISRQILSYYVFWFLKCRGFTDGRLGPGRLHPSAPEDSARSLGARGDARPQPGKNDGETKDAGRPDQKARRDGGTGSDPAEHSCRRARDGRAGIRGLSMAYLAFERWTEKCIDGWPGRTVLTHMDSMVLLRDPRPVVGLQPRPSPIVPLRPQHRLTITSSPIRCASLEKLAPCGAASSGARRSST